MKKDFCSMVFHKIKMKALYNFFVYFLDKCFPKNNIDSSVETAELYISDPDPDQRVLL